MTKSPFPLLDPIMLGPLLAYLNVYFGAPLPELYVMIAVAVRKHGSYTQYYSLKQLSILDCYNLKPTNRVELYGNYRVLLFCCSSLCSSMSCHSDTVQPHLYGHHMIAHIYIRSPWVGDTLLSGTEPWSCSVHCIAAFKESHFIVVTVSFSAP